MRALDTRPTIRTMTRSGSVQVVHVKGKETAMSLRATAAAAMFFTLSGVSAGEAAQEKRESKDVSPQSIYDFTMKDIDGNDVALSRYKGNVVLIVNVASQ